MVREEVQNRLMDHRTFGFPQEPLHPPSDFLRKRTRSAFARPPPDHNHFEVRLKAPLDHLGGKIVHNQVNHLRENIRRAESAKPRRPATSSGHLRCDTKKGDFFPLDRSGLVPKYVLQPKFGRVPKYLEQRKREAEERLQQEQERIQENQKGPKLISEAERLELLQGLRSNWEALQQDYKRLPILTDTLPKKARKTHMENELKQIEKDMMFLEINRYIAIQEDF